MTQPPIAEEPGYVQPYDAYEAYCCVIMPAEPERGLLEGDCEWSWRAGRYESDADCEVQLSFHLMTEHGIDRPLPHGYEYMQATLDKSLNAWRAAEG